MIIFYTILIELLFQIIKDIWAVKSIKDSSKFYVVQGVHIITKLTQTNSAPIQASYCKCITFGDVFFLALLAVVPLGKIKYIAKCVFIKVWLCDLRSNTKWNPR